MNGQIDRPYIYWLGVLVLIVLLLTGCGGQGNPRATSFLTAPSPGEHGTPAAPEDTGGQAGGTMATPDATELAEETNAGTAGSPEPGLLPILTPCATVTPGSGTPSPTDAPTPEGQATALPTVEGGVIPCPLATQLAGESLATRAAAGATATP